MQLDFSETELLCKQLTTLVLPEVTTSEQMDVIGLP